MVQESKEEALVPPKSLVIKQVGPTQTGRDGLATIATSGLTGAHVSCQSYVLGVEKH